MSEVVIVSAVRTPIGRYGGVLKDIRPDDLAALAIAESVKRAGIDANLIEDVILGCANQSGEDNRNVARMAAILAGLPLHVAGQTVNRLCASGLQAIVSAAQAIATGMGDVFVAGGVESMTRAPFVMAKVEDAWGRGDRTLYDTTIGWRFTNPTLAAMHHPYAMGETAENVAEKWSIAREAQDEFALLSQQKANQAIASGRFNDEMLPVSVPAKKGEFTLIDRDEHPRADLTIEKLAMLKPAFRKGGTVTAGNSSGINDGAAALVLMSREKAEELGLRPLARLVTAAVAGVDPATMGIGPVPATQKALQRANLRLDQIDLIELNEAFAAQAIACVQDLGLPLDRLNINGGAIALGHPLGSSGARIVTTLVHEMQRRDCRYGLATMCVGVGQGMSAIFEKL